MPIFELIVAVSALTLLVLTLRAWHRQILYERERYLLELARWRRALDQQK